MANIWFTSDTHFLHKKVAEIRGFAAPPDHDAHIIQTWNRHVKQDDIVWLLGDVGIGDDDLILEAVSQLSGRIQLVSGNHDSVWPGHHRARHHHRKWMEVFESISPFASIRIGDRDVLMSHFPYEGDHTIVDRHSRFRLKDAGYWLLHGHVHSPQKTSGHPRQIHVGWDAWQLPASLSDVARLMNEMDSAQTQAA